MSVVWSTHTSGWHGTTRWLTLDHTPSRGWYWGPIFSLTQSAGGIWLRVGFKNAQNRSNACLKSIWSRVEDWGYFLCLIGKWILLKWVGLVQNELPWEMKENKWVAADWIRMLCICNMLISRDCIMLASQRHPLYLFGLRVTSRISFLKSKSRCVMGIHLNNSKTILFGKLSHLHFSKTTNKPKTFLETRWYGNGENAKIWGWVEAAAGDGGGLGGVVGTLVSLCPYDRSLSRLPPSSSASRSLWWKDGSF